MDYLLSPIRLNELEILIQNSVEKALKSLSNQPTSQAVTWFNLSELCNYLPDRPAKATVYSWVSLGKVPLHKNGKKLRFLKSEIDFWLGENRKKTNSEVKAEAANFLSQRKIK